MHFNLMSRASSCAPQVLDTDTEWTTAFLNRVSTWRISPLVLYNGSSHSFTHYVTVLWTRLISLDCALLIDSSLSTVYFFGIKYVCMKEYGNKSIFEQ